MPFLPPDCTWRCLIRASAMRGGMVGQDAPSRPMRVTVTFAAWLNSCSRGRLREGAESYAKALASDILR